MLCMLPEENIECLFLGLTGVKKELSEPSIGGTTASKESNLGLARENGAETLGITPTLFPEPKYSALQHVLNDAYNQAANGKGKERHANGLPFDKQPIMQIARMHGLAYLTGQAAKKLQEAHKLLEIRGTEAAEAELLGAINYTAAAVLWVREQKDKENGG